MRYRCNELGHHTIPANISSNANEEDNRIIVESQVETNFYSQKEKKPQKMRAMCSRFERNTRICRRKRLLRSS